MASSPALAPSLPLFDHGRVLIVDDSAVARAMLARIVDASDIFMVSRVVGTAAAALTFLADDEVDFILLDINMPGVSGLSALPDLIAAAPTAKIIVVSGAEAALVPSLAMGAAEAMPKPGGGRFNAHFGDKLIATLTRLWTAGEDTPAPLHPGLTSLPAATAKPRLGNDFDLIAIGASTGGIHALSDLLREVPLRRRTPIIISQHLPATFMPYFAAQLAMLSRRPCDVATDGMVLQPGRIVIAPGKAHICCERADTGAVMLRLSTNPAASGCMPSVDPMLASAADVTGPRLMAVILSGMGRDGLEGTRAAHEAGACVLAQDSASSVIWGMPGAVVMAGLANATLPPDAIGRIIANGARL